MLELEVVMAEGVSMLRTSELEPTSSRPAG